ncbi:MAG TPA: choice-of-anchor Q domain-containing protein, partial [Roseiflexaceae bacterium]
SAPGADCLISGAITSSGHNLSSDSSCGFTAGGDLQNTNPLLGPLAANGGPTPTHALLPGSPAFEAGTNTGCPATDQRGILRPQGIFCDIGAFERVVVQTVFLPLVVK